jgi:hypothetical protein
VVLELELWREDRSGGLVDEDNDKDQVILIARIFFERVNLSKNSLAFVINL